MGSQAGTRIVNGINTRNLHGKDYVEVNERTRILHELRKSGEIKEFEMVESEPREVGARLVWRCSALIDNKLYIGNAEVKLDAPKNTPDGTNPFECAETSAFGRMLAFAGLGTIESIASYDEVMRGQPFVAVIEQAQPRVVEASKQRQIAQPQTTVIEDKPPVDQSVIDDLRELMPRAKALGIAKDYKSFYEWISIKLNKPILSAANLTPAHMVDVKDEVYKAELQAASEKAAVGK